MPLKYLAIIITEAVSIEGENHFPSGDALDPTIVECEESVARQIVHSRKAEFIPDEEESDEDKIQEIMEAIAKLDLEKDFGKNEKPNVKAIEAVLGFDITADERDHAWEQMEDAE